MEEVGNELPTEPSEVSPEQPATEEQPCDATEALPAPTTEPEDLPPAEPTRSDSEAQQSQKAKDADKADLSDIASAEGALHVAARSGNTESVQMLLRHKADPMSLDSNGQTALSIAKEMGHTEVVRLLRVPTQSSPKEPKPTADSAADRPAAEATAPAKLDDSDSLAVAVKSSSKNVLAKSASFGSLDALPPVSQSPARVPKSKGEHEPPSATASLRADVERILGGSFLDESAGMMSQGSMKRSKPPPAATTNGVMKGPTYMVSHSKWSASPKWSLGMKPKSTLVKPDTGPSPGTYDLPPPERSKYKTCPRFGFGIGSRFGVSEGAFKQNPGPGAYQPKDPSLMVGTKVGFGTSVRGSLGTSGTMFFPGPGAYELKNTMGGGLMFTAKGKQPTSYLSRSQSVPGPGAYTPSTRFAYHEPPKCGFGTSSRDSEAARASRTQGNPGPGAYEMQYHAGIGRDSKKFSATSRRRIHDLNSYLTPGPGAYNAHVTSFGY